MIPSTGSEIGAGGNAALIQDAASGAALGKAQRAGWANAVAAGSSLTAAATSESFRSNWAAVLASLGGGTEGSGKQESGAETSSALAGSMLTKSTQNASPPASLSAAGSSPRSRQGTTQSGGAANETEALPSAISKAGIAPVRRTSAGPVLKIAAPESLAVEAHSASSRKSTKIEKDPAAGSSAAPPALSGITLPLASFSPNPLAAANADWAREGSSRTKLTADSENEACSSTPGLGESITAHSGAQSRRNALPAGESVDRVGGPALQGRSRPIETTALSIAARGNAAGAVLAETRTSVADQQEIPVLRGDATSSGRPRPGAEHLSGTLGQNQVQAQPGGREIDGAAAAMGSSRVDQGALAGNGAAAESIQSPSVAPIVSKAGQPGAAQGMGTGVRSARAAGRGAAMPEGQSALATQDTTNGALARDPAALRGEIGGLVSSGTESTRAATSQPKAQTDEAFAALDAQGSSAAPTWIHAGAQRAEAGFEDPSLGWVGVRADVSGGGVHAAVVPGSAAAAQALDGHLAGLNSYLAEQHASVQTVTLAAPEGKWAETGMDQNSNQTMHQGAGQDAGQGSSPGQQFGAQTSAAAFAAPANIDLPAKPGSTEVTVPSTVSGGGHISVMA